MTKQLSTAAAAAKSLQSCPTLWDPIDGSPPGSAVPGIFQTRVNISSKISTFQIKLTTNKEAPFTHRDFSGDPVAKILHEAWV